MQPLSKDRKFEVMCSAGKSVACSGEISFAAGLTPLPSMASLEPCSSQKQIALSTCMFSDLIKTCVRQLVHYASGQCDAWLVCCVQSKREAGALMTPTP
jgi:hypothetical protein